MNIKEVKIASKKLSSNGCLLFSVPAFQFYYSNFDRSVGHHKRYCKKDFIKLAKKSNLEIDKMIYYDSIGLIFLLLNKLFNLKSTNLKSKIFLWNLLIPFSKCLDFITFNKFGKSLLCIMKKR